MVNTNDKVPRYDIVSSLFYLFPLYSVILSVLDPRKCEYLKEDSLHFEHAYMTTYIPCFVRSMSILEEMLETFATTVQAELNATLYVCESGLQDVLTNRSNFASNVVFEFLYRAWLVSKWFMNLFGEDDEDEL